MRPVEQWIWLPKDLYPNHQTTRYSERTHKNKETNYTVAAFERAYRFPIAIAEVQLRFSGDTALALFCNGDPIANWDKHNETIHRRTEKLNSFFTLL